MRFAYADPPYPGYAGYYPEKTEVDHPSLLQRLRREFPDGWALSTSAAALYQVWSLCPEARLCIWVRATRVVKARQALSGYEPLLVASGRPRRQAVVEDLRDVLVYRGRHRSFPGALIGMKPPAFAEWMFRLLGARAGDTLVDLFPGSGAIGEAWRRYTAAGSDTSQPGESDTSLLDPGDTSLSPGGDVSLLDHSDGPADAA
jgi:hypothetical protein